MCHLVLLLPVFGLVVFWLFPLPVAAPIYMLILAFSVWMYRAIMQAMNRPVVTGSEGMVGQIGEVVDVSRNFFGILVHGEIWKAKSASVVRKGQRVRVIGLEGLVLKVEDADAQSTSANPSCVMRHASVKEF